MRCLILLSVCLLLLSCKKGSEAPGEPDRNMVVYESDGFTTRTDTPIPNVRVDCYAVYNTTPGAPAPVPFSTGYTDNMGRYTFTKEQLTKAQNGSITLSKEGYSKYWFTSPPTTTYLYPVAQLSVRFIRERSYPDSILIEYNILPAHSTSKWPALYPVPADTVVRLEVPGNKAYEFRWAMYLKKDCNFGICTYGITSGTIPNLVLTKFADTTLVVRY